MLFLWCNVKHTASWQCGTYVTMLLKNIFCNSTSKVPKWLLRWFVIVTSGFHFIIAWNTLLEGLENLEKSGIYFAESGERKKYTHALHFVSHEYIVTDVALSTADVSFVFTAEPWYQWTKWNHIPDVKRREERFLPNSCKGSTAATVLRIQTGYKDVWREELRWQIQTGRDFTAAWVSNYVSIVYSDDINQVWFTKVVVWFNDNSVGHINEVALRWAHLVLGWVTESSS